MGTVLSTNPDGSYDVEFAADGEYENEVCKNVKEVEEELDHHANAKELLVHHANCEPKAHGALGLLFAYYPYYLHNTSKNPHFIFVHLSRK